MGKAGLPRPLAFAPADRVELTSSTVALLWIRERPAGKSGRRGGRPWAVDSRAVRRRIDLDGCHNFRDLGGYPTGDGRTLRWRTLFRSDALHHLTPGDVARLRDELAIGDLIDLRSTRELRVDGRVQDATKLVVVN